MGRQRLAQRRALRPERHPRDEVLALAVVRGPADADRQLDQEEGGEGGLDGQDVQRRVHQVPGACDSVRQALPLREPRRGARPHDRPRAREALRLRERAEDDHFGRQHARVERQLYLDDDHEAEQSEVHPGGHGQGVDRQLRHHLGRSRVSASERRRGLRTPGPRRGQAEARHADVRQPTGHQVLGRHPAARTGGFEGQHPRQRRAHRDAQQCQGQVHRDRGVSGDSRQDLRGDRQDAFAVPEGRQAWLHPLLRDVGSGRHQRDVRVLVERLPRRLPYGPL
mmetsp:Transcript_149591/g.480092  ORF Transcript_149591/g.480092 Transcript_149591/m.480092 type:complete len:281 (-) Transcript_149591:2375-3217(-)